MKRGRKQLFAAFSCPQGNFTCEANLNATQSVFLRKSSITVHESELIQIEVPNTIASFTGSKFILHTINHYSVYRNFIRKIAYLNTLFRINPLVIKNVNTKQFGITVNAGYFQLPTFAFPHFHFAFFNVLQLAINIRLIRPQRFLYFL